MTTRKTENNDHSENGRASISDSLTQLEAHFESELSGARQATRSHLIRFLANSLKVAEETADRVFVQLQRLRVIERAKDAGPDESRLQASHGWHIHNDEKVQPQLQELDRTEIAPAPVESNPEFAAAEDLLRRAIAARASDIHLDPYADEVEVRFRIDGRLEHYCRLSDLVAARIIAQFKLMAELDVAEPFEPQEGHLELPLEFDAYSGRVTVVPVAGGEAVAIRILHRDHLVRPLDELGFVTDQRATIDRLLESSEGIVLVSGPTGSGKTTTLYSLLHALDDGHRNIVTIENPIEFHLPAFLQIEVDERHQVTSSRALKTVLRMDPDIVMLGEIRDEEAAALAMRAADTGTFVLGSLHARDAASVITAMRDLDVDPRSLAANLQAVISQRLVRRLCENCREARPITQDERSWFVDADVDPPDEVSHPVGCSHCRGTGYYERIGVFEVAENTKELAEAIKSGAAESDIRSILRGSGVESHSMNALEKVRRGTTSVEEVRRIRWVSSERRSHDWTGPDGFVESGNRQES